MKIRKRIFVTIFGTDTPAGKAFDVALLYLIIISVLVVILESVTSIRDTHPGFFMSTEWFFTIIFTIEYLLRVYSSPHPMKYITSFFGVIDLLAILPSYLGLFFDQPTFLLTIRALRLLRMFRVFKLGRYLKEAAILVKALQMSIIRLLFSLVPYSPWCLSWVLLLYLIEGEEHGFSSIPQSIYWAIVTITTVGYGDIAPATVLGKILASVAMLTGYSIIAVPTGIITVEIGKAVRSGKGVSGKVCNGCGHLDHDHDANHCKICGASLPDKIP